MDEGSPNDLILTIILFLKTLSPNSHMLRRLGVRTSTYECWGGTGQLLTRGVAQQKYEQSARKPEGGVISYHWALGIWEQPRGPRSLNRVLSHWGEK